MTALTMSLVTFALAFGGAMVGMHIRGSLSDEHLREDVRDVIRLCTGLIATMAALVLGLLIASAKNSYDTRSTQIRQITADIIIIDLDLDQYGLKARSLRTMLRDEIPILINQIWTDGDRSNSSTYSANLEAREFVKQIRQLQPTDDSERALQQQIRGSVAALVQARLSLFTESGDAIPRPFLAILVFWLAIIFASFGLFVRQNRIVVLTFFVAGLSVASAIFLILEMGQPFAGLMQISSDGPVHALAPLGP